MQHVSPCHGEKLVVDVHTVLFWLEYALEVGSVTAGSGVAYLVAWVLVDASPVAMVVAAILKVVGVMSGYGQSAVSSQLVASALTMRAGAGAAVHSPIRCHCDHWNDVEQQTGLVGGERRLINRLVRRAGVWCRAGGSAGQKTACAVAGWGSSQRSQRPAAECRWDGQQQ